MTWTIITRLSCDADGCEESVSITDETTRAMKRTVVNQARTLGWWYEQARGYARCPQHAPVQHYSDLAFEAREARSAAEEQAERWAESA